MSRPCPLSLFVPAFVPLFVLLLAACPEPPDEETFVTAELKSAPFSVEALPVPPELDQLAGGFWLESGEILAAARYPGASDAKLGVLDRHGGGFRCITCGLEEAKDLGRPQPFADGRRILAQSPSSSNVLRDFEHWVLTCTPSIADCEEVRAERLRGLPASPQGLQERWPAVSPDGRYLAWTRLTTTGYRILFAELVRDARGYVARGARVLTPVHHRDTAAGLAAATAWYEVKGFTEDGRGLLVGATRGGTLNLDAFRLDLATGRWDRLTRDPDWDEDHELSPDGRWFVVGSARGEDTLTPFSLVPLPPLLDFALVAPVAYYHIGGSSRRSGRRQLWRFPMDGDRTEAGQRLQAEPGSGQVLATGPELSADGRLVLFGQRVPGTPERDLFVGAFEEPASGPVAAAPTPEPTWAPMADAAEAAALPAWLCQSVRGPGGGAADVRWAGGTTGGSFSVTYRAFVNEEGLIFDGVQSYLGGPLAGFYFADVQVRGAATGRVSAELVIAETQRRGELRAELNGRVVARRY